MSLDESRFATLAAVRLDHLAEVLENAGFDVEAQGGVVTVELEDGRQFVLNKHLPMRQIWLSSPVSGAWHYAPDDEGRVWRATKGGQELEARLIEDFEKATGRTVAF
jgi:frataxin